VNEVPDRAERDVRVIANPRVGDEDIGEKHEQ
jgi:hypothetical protein